MNRIDWKSFLIGALLTLSIFLGVGAAYQKKGEEATKTTEGNPVGRFRIVAAGDARGVAVFVLDTTTGQVWANDHAPANNSSPSGGVDKGFLVPRVKPGK
jgi:hypothetical protein